MIHLGCDPQHKRELIRTEVLAGNYRKVVLLSPAKFAFDPGVEHQAVDWPEIIMYRTFYPLLQSIDETTLVVVNECLRTQDRNDLTYNCMRHYLAQAGGQLVFQRFPFIDELEDFMILFDFDTRSRWKRERYDEDLLRECGLTIQPRTPNIVPVNVPISATLYHHYQEEKRERFAKLGKKDPNTLPRTLYLWGGKPKLEHIHPKFWHIGRNNRFRLEHFQTYKEHDFKHAPYVVFELPHNIVDFIDFLTISEQVEVKVLSTDLPADKWYVERYSAWARRLDHGYASLSTRL